jgi:hypothetical protein
MVVEAGTPHLTPAMVAPVMPITRSDDSGIGCYFVVRIARQARDGTTTEPRGFVIGSVVLQQAVGIEVIVDVRWRIIVEINQLLG